MTTLSPVLDTAAAGPLRVAMRHAIERGQPIELNGAGVERVGQACLQVLTAAMAAAAAAGLAFRIADPSPVLTEMIALAHLDLLPSA